jgi:hypothetical protein
MASVAHFQTSTNNQSLFACDPGEKLAQSVAAARAILVSDSSPRRNANHARDVARLLRRRHEHSLRCASCLLKEVFEGAKQ